MTPLNQRVGSDGPMTRYSDTFTQHWEIMNPIRFILFELQYLSPLRLREDNQKLNAQKIISMLPLIRLLSD